MKKSTLFLLLLISVSFLQLPARTTTIHLANLGLRPDKKANATETVSRYLEKACNNSNPSDTLILIFPKGEYHFHPSEKHERRLFISNHDQDNPKSLGILLDRSNTTLDFSGSDLLFHGRMLPLAICNASDIVLKNASIDFPNPHIAQVEITRCDTIAGTITYRPAPWVRWRINDRDQFEIYGDGWNLVPCAGIAFHPATRRILYRTADIAVGTEHVSSPAPGLVTAPWRDKRLPEGTIVAMRGYGRPAPGILIDSCSRVSISNIRVHYAEGMGLLAQNTTDITLTHFGVCLRNDNDPRYFTTQADATHFSGCRGKILSTDGLYEGMMDDAINIHGTYLRIDSLISPTRLRGRYMHPQTYGIAWGVPGDTVSFISSPTMEITGAANRIKSITPDPARSSGYKTLIISLTDSIPEEILHKTADPAFSSLFGIENISASPSVCFSGNTIRNNRARGALFSTPRHVVCTDNLFDHTSGSAILLCGDCNGWYETGACRDVEIYGNRFVNALTSEYQFTNAVISIYPEIPHLDRQAKPFHSGITIRNNIFHSFGTPLLYARSVSELLFQDNRLVRTSDFIPYHPEPVRNAVIIDRCEKTIISPTIE